jgi:RNA polymerase sigma-70 factor (ECF subfamily)
MPPASSENTRWFAEEVQPHESALRSYLKHQFPGVTDHDDLVQETYSRMLRAKVTGSVRHARAFLFTTARNAALDFLRRRQARPAQELTHSDAWCVLNDNESNATPAEIVDREQEFRMLTEAVQSLPGRCREAIALRYIEGLSYREIAERMGVSLETVKTQLATGLRRCGDHLAARGVERFPGSGQDTLS